MSWINTASMLADGAAARAVMSGVSKFEASIGFTKETWSSKLIGNTVNNSHTIRVAGTVSESGAWSGVARLIEHRGNAVYADANALRESISGMTNVTFKIG